MCYCTAVHGAGARALDNTFLEVYMEGTRGKRRGQRALGRRSTTLLPGDTAPPAPSSALRRLLAEKDEALAAAAVGAAARHGGGC